MHGLLLLVNVTWMLFIGVSTHGPFWVLYGVACSVLMCWPEHALQMNENPFVSNSNCTRLYSSFTHLDSWFF